MNILLWAVPVFAVTMLIEWRLTLRHQVIGYQLRDSVTNISMGLGNLGLQFVVKMFTLVLFLGLYEHRLFDIPTEAWWFWPLLFVVDDLCHYTFHRASHELRFLWAAHVNHHSSQTYNLSTALRQSWTTPFTGFMFWVPLPLLGFHPLAMAVAQAVSLLYQYWLHTELIARLGPFEWVFNTPSHHRVHHGTEARYLDRNHGAILIIWDRLFGTFEPERGPTAYGLTRNIESHNLLTVAFHEWRDILSDVRGAESWRGRLGYFFGPPGWREDGTGATSKVLRARASAAESVPRVGAAATRLVEAA